MKSIIVILISIIVASCSKEGSGAKSSSGLKVASGSITTELSAKEVEAKKELQESLKKLQQGNYKIEKDDLNALVSEGLLTKEELKALTIVK